MANVQETAAAGIVTPAELKKLQEERDSAAALDAMEKMRRAKQEQQNAPKR